MPLNAKPLARLYRKLRLALSGFECHALMPSGRIVKHKALDRADALEWAACYGSDSDVAVGRFGRLITGRLAAAS